VGVLGGSPPRAIRLTISFAGSKKLHQPFLYASVFFFHFCKVACGTTSALHVVLNWLTFRFVGGFFFVPLPNYWSPSGCHIIVKVKFLALLSNLKEKKSGYVSN
jgi:hypothetical protein